ncbi:MAG: DUF456 domain-containing protein [Stenotrophomonas sp.]
MDTSFILYLVAAILVITGLAGVVLPVLPGIPLVFAGLLLAAWADGFQHVGWLPLLILGLLTLASLAIDLFATTAGAQRLGASRKALWGSLLGTFAGLFFMPIGLFVGPFVGALLGEYWHGRQIGQAAKVGVSTWLGILLGIAFKLGLALAMLGLFVFAWLI